MPKKRPHSRRTQTARFMIISVVVIPCSWGKGTCWRYVAISHRIIFRTRGCLDRHQKGKDYGIKEGAACADRFKAGRTPAAPA
jgi:hypothetical protein